MGILSAGATDIGLKRKTNQDSICIDRQNHLYAVADGMGGHNGGDIASQLSVSIMSKYIDENSQNSPENLLKNLIFEINKQILNKAQQDPELQGMGTTVSVIYFAGPELLIGNVGDSRVYMINNRNIYQLTRDHSFVQEKLNLGIYSRADAVHDPQKNVLVRSVGFEADVNPDIFHYRINKNDIFLVCSDGLHGKVSDADILHIVQKNIIDPAVCNLTEIESAVKELIDQANQNGGQDNISVVLVVAQA
ncbi:MAG: Stp1/IreP family PP2C-type Ser/Thr phosphatase [Bacteriovoracaceae bacterium]